MKKLEKEIEGSVFSTNILKKLETINTKVNFGVELNLTKEEYEIFEDSFGRGKIKIVCEVEEPILDEIEREYLRGVIKPFKEQVENISKQYCMGEEFLRMEFKNGKVLCFPNFKKRTMYKGMEVAREYSLKELGL